ncbi:MAG: hypothetical protein IID05_04275 [Gemmatimonadetes bacterium]|nr:hypothetical protein [Gemmatimonadota bacterium]
MTKRDPNERVRLKEFEITQLPDGQCTGRVVVAWHSGANFIGTAEGTDSPQGRLRCAAEAAAHALEQATDSEVVLQVLAVKAIEPFDTIIVIISLEIADVVKRLVGSCLVKEQMALGAVLAVLSATNRLLGTASRLLAR